MDYCNNIEPYETKIEELEKELADLKKLLREVYDYCTTNYIMPDWKGTPLDKLKQAIGEEVK